jgi:fructose-1,6-bisphosphatase I/sedoheptulose-1,7-bisphosphatase
MPHTLTQFLIEERRRFPLASGDFNSLILDVALACKAIARKVACGRLAGLTHEALAAQYRLPARQPNGKYLLLFEPLDGAANLDVNVAVGSIFSVLRADDALQAGTEQVAAGYAIYGPATMLVLTVGNGVNGFTLDAGLGEFMLTHPGMQVPDETQEFAIDASNSRFWEGAVKRYVDECLAGQGGRRGRDFTMRWIASLVAEAHRILLRGGVFLCPRDSRPGRVRLLQAANPIGMLIEQAGGRASTGRGPLLAVPPASLQQCIGFVFGSAREVERIERYHGDPKPVELHNPLFNEHGLFRMPA